MSQSQGHNERELENILNELGEFNNERNEVENGDSILQGGAKDCEEDIKKFELKNEKIAVLAVLKNQIKLNQFISSTVGIQ